MTLLTIIVFALALNMDALATGVAYGIRKIKIPLSSLLIISSMSVFSILISMALGQALAHFLSESFAHKLGGGMLVFIGVWLLAQAWREHNPKTKPVGDVTSTKKQLMQIRIKALGLVIQVLREPSKADLDQSGIISPKEAMLLGIALAMDSFGAGIAVSMLGFQPLLTALVVGVGHIVLTYLGLLMGNGFAATRMGQKMAVLPGFLLITLGLFKLY